MTRTHLATTLLTFALGAATPALASHPDDDSFGYFDEAQVLSSTPRYEEYREPRRSCWSEPVTYYREAPPAHRSYTGAVLGTLVGGILGNQIGGGTGKTVATAVGAATGAIVGDNLANRDRYGPPGRYVEQRERCREDDHWSRRVVGYDVRYRYQGRDYSTVLPYDPGATLRLRVNVSVAE